MLGTMAEKFHVMTVSDVVRHNLRKARNERGLSQRGVAAHVGWSQTTVRDLEGGRRAKTISPEDLVTLAILYGRSVAELYVPPDSVEDNGQDIPVKVEHQSDQLSPEVFYRLAFLMGPEARAVLGNLQHLRDQETGELHPSTAAAWYRDLWAEASAKAGDLGLLDAPTEALLAGEGDLNELTRIIFGQIAKDWGDQVAIQAYVALSRHLEPRDFGIDIDKDQINEAIGEVLGQIRREKDMDNES